MTFECPKELELHRVLLAGYPIGDRTNGCLQIKRRGLGMIFSDGDGWEHVSVSRQSRVPSYEDMDWVKRQFWSDDQCVMQLHVPRSDHINCNEFVLHLWRPIGQEIPRPPGYMVGPVASSK